LIDKKAKKTDIEIRFFLSVFGSLKYSYVFSNNVRFYHMEKYCQGLFEIFLVFFRNIFDYTDKKSDYTPLDTFYLTGQAD